MTKNYVAKFTALLHIVYVNGADNNRQCTCELCLPNWYLGYDGQFQLEPPERAKRDKADVDAMLQRHLAKTAGDGLAAEVH